MTDPIRRVVREGGERARAEAEAQKLRDELQTVDPQTIAAMSDIDLASWASRYPPGSPQAILAGYDWQRRLTDMQVDATRFSAKLGIAGVVVGALLGAALTQCAANSAKEEAKAADSKKAHASSKTDVQSPVAAPEPQALRASDAPKQPVKANEGK